MLTKNLYKKHDKCQVEIRWKVSKDNAHPVPGLYCSQHNIWIKWLSREDAFYLINELKVPVALQRK